MTIFQKIIAVLCLATVTVFGTTIVLISMTVGKTFTKDAENNLGNVNGLILMAVESYEKSMHQSADILHKAFTSEFPLGIRTNGSTMKVGEHVVPVLVHGGETLNLNFSVVDRFSGRMGGVATVFAKKGDDFVRVTTSLKKQDGSRAIATTLDRGHPGYKPSLEGRPYTGKATLFGRDYMTKYTPIMENGRVIGLLFIGVDFTEGLKALKDSVKQRKIGSTGYSFVISTDKKSPGSFIIHPTLEGKNLISEKDPKSGPFIREMLDRGEGMIEYVWADKEGDRPTRKIVSFTKFEPWNWIVASGIDRQELNADVRKIEWYLAVGGLVSIIVLVFSLFIIFGRLIRAPLEEAITFAETVASGNLTVRMKRSTNDEIGRLFISMNHMADKLESLIYKIKGAVADMESAGTRLSQNSMELSTEVSAQLERASQVATSSTEMSQTAIDIAGNATGIADASNTGTVMAKRGEADVAESEHEIVLISEIVTDTSNLISSLGDRSKQIGDIVATIKDIADQTNLLALNAAIEAARAGEQGRGFAVVADEVRKLAERTSRATDEIGNTIISIQREIDTTVGSMSLVKDKVGSGVALSKKVAESIKGVTLEVSNLQSMVQQIASATVQMSTTTESINVDMENMVSTTHETKSKADALSRESEDLAKTAQALIHSISEFKVK